MKTLTQWLAGLDLPQLQAILARRPDVQLDAADSEALAAALQHPASMRSLSEQLSLPQLQVLEVVVSLGAAATLASVAALLEDSGEGHIERVSCLLDDLYGFAAAWPLPDGRVATVGSTASLFPHPLGTSGTLHELLAPLSLTDLRRMLMGLGHPRSVNPRDDVVRAVVATLSDPQWVREQVISTEAAVCEPLLALAKGATEPAEPHDFSDEPPDPYEDYPPAYPVDSWGRHRTRHELFQHQSKAIRWAAARGIVIGARWGYDWRMPSEVALALRGTAWRAPFTPHPPESTVGPADAQGTAASTAAAVGDFTQQATAVLDMVARYDWPMAKGGGLATRELSRLAKTAVVTTTAARLVLELADQADLLRRRDGSLQVSDEFGAWRAAAPGARFATLVRAWWWMAFAPTSTSSGRRKTIRPLERSTLCYPTDSARQALILLLASLPGDRATSLPSLMATLSWQRPRLSAISGYEPEPWSIAWSEAEQLGVIAGGVLSPVGRALPGLQTGAQGFDTLVALAAELLPASSGRATLGSDLTAMVIGLPTARVSLLLDSVADRESSSAVACWRFSVDSVRRALDQGADVATMIEHLESVAESALPQPLLYLLRDVDRRHGEVRLSGHGTLLRGEDPILMTQLIGDRSLHRLGLRLLAPTILTSRLPLEESLAALRRCGYFPIPEGDPAEWIDLRDAG